MMAVETFIKKLGGGCVYWKQVPWQIVGANSSLKAPWKHRMLMDLGGMVMVDIQANIRRDFQWGNWCSQVDKFRIWMSSDEHGEVVPWSSANFWGKHGCWTRRYTESTEEMGFDFHSPSTPWWTVPILGFFPEMDLRTPRKAYAICLNTCNP